VRFDVLELVMKPMPLPMRMVVILPLVGRERQDPAPTRRCLFLRLFFVREERGVNLRRKLRVPAVARPPAGAFSRLSIPSFRSKK